MVKYKDFLKLKTGKDSLFNFCVGFLDSPKFGLLLVLCLISRNEAINKGNSSMKK